MYRWSDEVSFAIGRREEVVSCATERLHREMATAAELPLVRCRARLFQVTAGLRSIIAVGGEKGGGVSPVV